MRRIKAADGTDVGQESRTESRAVRLREEERVNSLTHGIGLALSVPGVVLLLYAVCRHGDAWQFAGSSIYGGTLVAVYAASTLSHIFRRPSLRRVFRIIDQALIFLLIAGTYTPIALTYLRDGWW